MTAQMQPMSFDNVPVEFTVPGKLVPWARSGGGKNVVRFTPAKQRSYMAVLRDYAALAMRGRELLNGPIDLQLLAVYPWPNSWSARKRALPGAEWMTSKPDGDNIQKIAKDAFNKIVWTDDARVASWHGWKKRGDKPRLVVRIVQLAPALK